MLYYLVLVVITSLLLVTQAGLGNVTSGCVPCQCNSIGSSSSVCDPITGHCSCHPGVHGPHCDQCLSHYYGFSDTGCKRKCDTLFFWNYIQPPTEFFNLLVSIKKSVWRWCYIGGLSYKMYMLTSDAHIISCLRCSLLLIAAVNFILYTVLNFIPNIIYSILIKNKNAVSFAYIM